MQTIGFVGASGLMGRGMALNIAKAGFDLRYTVHSSPVEGLAALGAVQAGSYAELGADCDAVVVCVTSADDVERVVAGPDGLLTSPKPGLIIVDSSTSEPATTLRLAELAAATGVRFVDAPLTRGPKEAQEGRLNVIVGADDETFAEVATLLGTFAENIFRAGPTGAGHTVKLLNNFCVQAAATGLAEAFGVAAKVGADPQVLVDVLAAGMFDNALLHIMEKTLSGDYEGMTFMLDNARKDVRYYTRLAAGRGVPSVVGDGVHEALTIASALGYGQEFVPSLVRAQEKLNGVTIAGA